MKILNKKTTPPSKVPGTTYIGRGSVLGNPFVIGVHGSRMAVVNMYFDYLVDKLLSFDEIIITEFANLTEDSDLLCYCKPKQCHGLIIAKLWSEIYNEDVSVVSEHYNLYGPNTNTVDHINVGKIATSDLGRSLNKLIVKCWKETIRMFAKVEGEGRKGHQYGFSKIFKVNIADAINSDLKLLDKFKATTLPFKLYGVEEDRIVRPVSGYFITYVLHELRATLNNKSHLLIKGLEHIKGYEKLSDTYKLLQRQAEFLTIDDDSLVFEYGQMLSEEFDIRLVPHYYFHDRFFTKNQEIRRREATEYCDELLYFYKTEEDLDQLLIKSFENKQRVVTLLKLQ